MTRDGRLTGVGGRALPVEQMATKRTEAELGQPVELRDGTADTDTVARSDGDSEAVVEDEDPLGGRRVGVGIAAPPADRSHRTRPGRPDSHRPRPLDGWLCPSRGLVGAGTLDGVDRCRRIAAILDVDHREGEGVVDTIVSGGSLVSWSVTLAAITVSVQDSPSAKSAVGSSVNVVPSPVTVAVWPSYGAVDRIPRRRSHRPAR